MNDRRNTTDPLFPPPPKAAEKEEKAPEKPLEIGVGYTPDVFKVKGAESKGHANAAYQGAARAPRSGEDTQKLQPPVVIDETRQEGFSGREIRELMKEIEVEKQREGETVSIEAAPKPATRRSGVVVLLAIAVVLLLGGLVVAFAKPHDVAPTVASSSPVPTTPAASAASSNVPAIASTDVVASVATAISTTPIAVSSHSLSVTTSQVPTASTTKHSASSGTVTTASAPVASTPSSAPSSHDLIMHP